MSASQRVFARVPPEIYEEISGWPGFNVYHTKCWHEVLEQGAGFVVGGLAGYKRDGALWYWLPLVRKRRLFRRVSVCLPLSDKVGPLWNPALDPGRVEIAEDDNVLEIHGMLLAGDTVHRVLNRHTTLHIGDADSEDALLGLVRDPAIGRRIRKATRLGFRCNKRDLKYDYQAFDLLQALTRRRQGVPTYPKGFFHAIRDRMASSGNAGLFLAFMNDKPVAGVIFLYYGDVAIYGYGASDETDEVRKSGANQLVMWEAIRDAYRRGMRTVEFGTSSIHHKSLIAYKEHWGGISEELGYTYAPDTRASSIEQNGLMARLGGNILRRLPMPIFKSVSTPLLRMVV